MSKKTSSKTEPARGPVYVYGLDENGKPRGARFPEHRDNIVSAAMDMGCRIVIDATPEFSGIATKLPAGRIYSSGKAFLPNIRKDLLEKLMAAGKGISIAKSKGGNGAAHPDPGGSSTRSPITSGLPRSWDAIDAGHMVLIHESPEDGWWEAVVQVRDGEILTLRFRDYPKQPTFVRHINTVALVNPGPL
ncbi:MAG: hypothetical protein HY242_01890 [Afipia sp.]|nr:hypothetical protein [Afipia sp.]